MAQNCPLVAIEEGASSSRYDAIFVRKIDAVEEDEGNESGIRGKSSYVCSIARGKIELNFGAESKGCGSEVRQILENHIYLIREEILNKLAAEEERRRAEQEYIENLRIELNQEEA